MSINKVVISGNLTRDAELRRTPSGTPLLNIGVAVNDRRRDSTTGDWEDYANFLDCTLFGKRAESLQQYLVKGTKVCIEGHLHYSSWNDRETGQKHSKVDITVDEIEFSTPRNGNGGGNAPARGNMDSADVAKTVQDSYPGAYVTEDRSGTHQDSAPSAYADKDIPF